jgi:hypothetical protein
MSEHRPLELNPARSPLADLPCIAPDRDVWSEVSSRLDVPMARSGRLPRRWLSLAAAAVLVVSLGLILLLSGRVEQQNSQLQSWIAYSQELEQELDILQRARQPVRGHQVMAIGELQDMVAAVDLALTRNRSTALTPEQELQLWQQRTVLLNDLVSVRTAAYMQPDSRTPQPVITLNPPVRPVAQTASYEL